MGRRRSSNNGRRVSNTGGNELNDKEVPATVDVEEIPGETPEAMNSRKEESLAEADAESVSASQGVSPEPPSSEVPDEADLVTDSVHSDKPDDETRRMSLAEQKKEQRAVRKRQVSEQFFDDIDANGDGEIDQPELKDALTEMGVIGPEKEDIGRFFLTGDTIKLDEFLTTDVLKKLKDVRLDYAEADLLEVEEIRTVREEGGVPKRFLPDRMVRVLLEFVDIASLKTLTATSSQLRKWASTDEYWKRSLLKRRRLEQMKASCNVHMIPEIKCGTNYFGWYMEWVKARCSEDGVKLWSKRMATELMNDGEPGVFTTPKIPSCLHIASPLEAAEASTEDDGAPPPPPPPPELPLMITGDEKGDVQLRCSSAPDPPLETLSEHDAVITCIASTDEKIFTGSEDCTTCVWKRGDYTRPQYNLIGHTEAISVIVCHFSPISDFLQNKKKATWCGR